MLHPLLPSSTAGCVCGPTLLAGMHATGLGGIILLLPVSGQALAPGYLPGVFHAFGLHWMSLWCRVCFLVVAVVWWPWIGSPQGEVLLECSPRRFGCPVV